MYTPSPLSAGGGGGGVVNLLPNFQNRGLDTTSVFRGVAGKEGVTLFKGGGWLHFLDQK